MSKFKITSPDGVIFGGKNLPKDTVVELDRGPHTDAWLRFKQAEEVKEAPPKPEKK
ncbi:MAG: hypothetical protein HZC55_04105 [Verrucomicrobia bacterium]|nr:hypothetical protein [Verrucomicrobiota bacterium]